MNTFKKAFTLAEVLITLLIIGVIASIVIPGIINDTNDAEYNAGVKKIYADLSAAVKIIQVNNGGDVPLNTPTSLLNDFCNVMSCTRRNASWEAINYKTYKGGNSGYILDNPNTTVGLNNGTILEFDTLNGDGKCETRGVNACASIYVDMNGQKGPNMWGKDYYIFYIVRKTPTSGPYLILPSGTQNDTYASSGSCQIGQGYGCAAVRLYNPDSMPK